MLVPFIIVAFVLLIIMGKGLKVIRPWEKGLVERLGKYQRTVDSGLNVIIPFLEIIKKVDMREQVVDVPPQGVITKDNVVVEVDAVVYYEVTDPIKVTYNVANFYTAATKLAQMNLRNLIGDMALDESLTSRATVNTQLRQILDDATDKWGTKVTRVELQRIEPPSDVTEAMHRQMKAERERRAMILEAEGQKKSAILKAEGEAEAIQKVAEAEKSFGARILTPPGIDLRNDLDDLSALMSALDLVLGVETFCCWHGAALGVETWTLSNASFWIWLGEHGRSIWSDNVRLFTKQRTQPLAPLIAEAEAALRQRLARHQKS